MPTKKTNQSVGRNIQKKASITPTSPNIREYASWLVELKRRYQKQQIKAAVQVNQALLEFYWELGKDIAERQFENSYGSGFYQKLSRDLQRELPDAKGFSPKNLWYVKRFYVLYSSIFRDSLQQEGELVNFPQLGGKLTIASEEQALLQLFCVPWGHHKLIMDKCFSAPDKALFYIRKTVEFNWSRSVLMNYLDTDLYEREGKAISNFQASLPQPQSDLAQELTRDPYNFNFLALESNYHEKELKAALIANITQFLLELGSGFAYMGKEYRNHPSQLHPRIW